MKKVSILLSVYNPDKNYLIKQLKSLDRQTYPNVDLIIHDDCPENRCDINLFNKYLKNIKYRILPYQRKNLGYQLAFERLVKSVKHKGYIVFCDQDDIWDKNKIKLMVEALENNKKELCVCDRSIIDEHDSIINKSVFKSSTLRSETWTNEDIIYPYSPFQTYALGIQILCTSRFAKECLPYNGIAHDKWLLCCSGALNNYYKIDKPLIKYRRHGNNVSGILKNVASKEDYYNHRIIPHDLIVNKLIEKYPNNQYNFIIKELSDARIHRNIFKMYKYRKYNSPNTILEIGMFLLPNFIFRQLLKMFK